MSFARPCVLVLLPLLVTGCPKPKEEVSSGPPAVDTARAATGSIGFAGGSVVATAADGTRYTLEVPVGALTTAVELRVTPITSMGSAPLASSLAGAVQMEPSGLTFQRPARLIIEGPPETAAGHRLVGFGTANDGSAFTLTAATRVAGKTELSVGHFSNAGLAEPTQAELDAVPLAELLDPHSAEGVLDAAIRLPSPFTAAQVAALFRPWFEAEIKPLLMSPAGNEDAAILEFERWFDAQRRMSILMGDETLLSRELATEFAFAQPILQSMFRTLVNKALTACSAQTYDLELARAFFLQRVAQNLALDTAGSGLELATLVGRVSECLQVTLDPIAMPTPVVGVAKSLDADAHLVFVGSPTPVGGSFEFTVTAIGATLGTPKGFSTAQGHFTTVYTATQAAVTFDVTACLVLQPLGARGTDVCVTQHLAPQQLPTLDLTATSDVTSNQSFTGNLPLTGSATTAKSTLSVTATRMDAGGITTFVVSGTLNVGTTVISDFIGARSLLNVRDIAVTVPSTVTYAVTPGWYTVNSGNPDVRLKLVFNSQSPGAASNAASISEIGRNTIDNPTTTLQLMPGSYLLGSEMNMECQNFSGPCSVSGSGEFARVTIAPQ